MRVAALVALGVLLCACSQNPTSIGVPAIAESIERFPILGGSAFKTQYTLKAAYPLTPALEYYRVQFGKPWLLCEWSGPAWHYFIDAQGDTPFAVHQQLYMWVNREAQREIMLSLRYLSEQNATLPDSDVQNVVLVEYMHANVAETVERLKLRCPNGEGSAH